MAIDCSELAGTITAIARNLASEGDFSIDDVVRVMRETFPQVTRQNVVDSIVNESKGQKRTISDLTKRLTAMKKEAKKDVELREAISGYETHLSEGTTPAKAGQKKVSRTVAIQELTDVKNTLMRQIAKSEPVLREKYEAEITKLTNRLKEVQTTPQTMKESDVDAPLSKELEQKLFERDSLRKEIRKTLDSFKPTSFWRKGLELSNAPQVMMTTGEFSAVLRQGKFAVFADPKAGGKAFVDMFKAFRSEKEVSKMERAMRDDPDMPKFALAGLSINFEGGPLTQMEESIMSRFADRIPIVKQFSRAHNAFLNSLRFNSMKGMEQAGKGFELTLDEAKIAANAINVFTGRGNLGELEQSADVLNAGLFSPRYQWSRLQLLTGQPLWTAQGSRANTSKIRKRILTQFYGRSIMGMASQYMLYGLLFGDTADYANMFNSLSSDFMKMKIGNTRLDPGVGLLQPIVFMNRAITGKFTTGAGETIDLRGPDAAFSRPDIVSNFVRSKLSPGVGQPYDAILGENMVGEEETIGGAIIESTTPITYEDVADVMMTDLGLPRRTAISILAFFGEGVQVHNNTSNSELSNNGMNVKDFNFTGKKKGRVRSRKGDDYLFKF